MFVQVISTFLTLHNMTCSIKILSNGQSQLTGDLMALEWVVMEQNVTQIMTRPIETPNYEEWYELKYPMDNECQVVVLEFPSKDIFKNYFSWVLFNKRSLIDIHFVIVKDEPMSLYGRPMCFAHDLYFLHDKV